MDALPVIDIAPLASGSAAERADVARAIGAACRTHGFFYIVGHGVDEALAARLETLARAFFALDLPTKLRWRMALGGRAWRGYFPPGGELTSGRPDWKEGLYFGSELGAADPRVQAGLPVHGPNLMPGGSDLPQLAGFTETVLAYIDALTTLGHRLMEGVALSLDLPADYFHARCTADPLILFRIFNYPTRPAPAGTDAAWGVGEHSDYGLLTILRQDDVGGLAVKTSDGWIAAPPLPASFVCNIGDMLDRMTGGLYRSTPHRVALNTSGRDRLSFPFFFDPAFGARVRPIEGLPAAPDDSAARWDRANVHAFDGTYGDYLLGKVGKVFPELRRAVL
ncbi:MAG: isopenicillin N synthase family oxygenase [Proteobacteria bacterium]|nr:isopenicillin N synthase family oxygenase [Pseudomonadota bacterium]